MVPPGVLHGDEWHARFDQASREQALLTDHRAAVRITRLVRFSADVECLPGERRSDQTMRLLMEAVESAGWIRGRFVTNPFQVVERLAERVARSRTTLGNARR